MLKAYILYLKKSQYKSAVKSSELKFNIAGNIDTRK